MTRDLRERVRRYEWLADSRVQVAGCVTVAVGIDEQAAATAFGMDLAGPALTSTEIDEAFEGIACLSNHTDDPRAVVVIEDNGFEGSRELVLRQLSRGGKAASLFWNVNGLLVFSCARKGQVLFSDDIGHDDPEDHEDLPRSLVPLLRLMGEEDADLVAIGAAMVAKYVGVDVDARALDGEWRSVDPQVDQPAVLTAQTSGMRWEHPDLVELLASVPDERRRPLTRLLVQLVVGEASLLGHEVAADVLATVTADGPGKSSGELEEWTRQVRREHDAWFKRMDAFYNNGGEEPLSEEGAVCHRAVASVRSLEYACHEDALTALLGVAEGAVSVYTSDGVADQLLGALRRLCATGPDDWASIVALLPPLPSPAHRAGALAEQKSAREAADRAAEEAFLAEEWGGLIPTERIQAADSGTRALAWTDRDLLEELGGLPDEVLRAIAVWTATRVLDETGLLRRPWLADILATLGEPIPAPVDVEQAMERSRRGAEQFAVMQADPDIVWTTYVDADGDHISQQHGALPVVWQVGDPNALAAAAGVLSSAAFALGPEYARLIDALRETFGLPC